MKLNLRKEDEILLLCGRTRMQPEFEDRIKSIMCEDLDWEYLINMASYHRFKPILYWQLEHVCSQRIPDEIACALKNYYECNVRKNLLMWGELLKILKKFDENEIKAIPYKGPILALMAYDNLSLREFDDLDLYVILKDISKVKNILPSLGYELLSQLKKSQEIVYIKFQREFKFINKFSNVLVELKWKFPVPSFSFKIDPNTIFISGTEIIELNNSKIETLSPEYLLILLSIHNAGHYWPYLSWICDISQLLMSQKFFDWSKVIDTASKLGVIRILNINLLLSSDLFGLKIPDDVLTQLNQDNNGKAVSEQIKRNLFSNKELNLGDKIILRLKIRENTINKLKDFFKLILTPTSDVITSTQLPYHLYFVYYLLRIFQLIKSILKTLFQ